ncbi:hypothetical protein [Shewanella sedimentimangrovi]|uniref:Uncharacterized protein n=1 Tax=Shewanella sedimentimangrovi TaxID=2814293 RepID=A0ABX7R4N8_9GAMM|nr:hypothetical protein [Shewanella sedimentimangrovi]QSX38664.1 hypothetical protein JYB85_07595 [Shewanella sedimentimangrovi]
MKFIILLIVLFSPLVKANDCIRVGEDGYDIKFPEGIANLSINGDKMAYCAKFKISPNQLSDWLKECGLTMDAINHGGEIYESNVPDGFITILNTGKDNVVYIGVTNTKEYIDFKDHIGVHRNCAL